MKKKQINNPKTDSTYLNLPPLSKNDKYRAHVKIDDLPQEKYKSTIDASFLEDYFKV